MTPSAVRIEADLLVPGHGAPVADGVVVLDGARITYAGPAAGAPPHDGPVTRVPTVMPGLWDAHVHLMGVKDLDLGKLLSEPHSVSVARAVRSAADLLQAGFTSVRELGGHGVYLARAIDEGTLTGPTIYGAGSHPEPHRRPRRLPRAVARGGDGLQRPRRRHPAVRRGAGLPQGRPPPAAQGRPGDQDLRVRRRAQRGRPPDPPAVLRRGAARDRRGGRPRRAGRRGALPRQARHHGRPGGRLPHHRARHLPRRGGRDRDARGRRDPGLDPGDRGADDPHARQGAAVRRDQDPGDPRPPCRVDARRARGGRHDRGRDGLRHRRPRHARPARAGRRGAGPPRRRRLHPAGGDRGGHRERPGHPRPAGAAVRAAGRRVRRRRHRRRRRPDPGRHDPRGPGPRHPRLEGRGPVKAPVA